jgi:hypothetical protein
MTSRSIAALLAAWLAAAPDAAAQSSLIAGAPVSIGPTPSVAVGPLESVVTPFLLASGELAVPSRESNTIAIYGRDGRPVRSYGGPDRVPFLRSAWARGDTVEAFELRGQRLTRFHPDGVIETISADRPADGASGGLRWGNVDDVIGPLGEGWAAAAIAGVRWNARDSMSLHALGRDGSTSQRVAVVDGMHRERYGNGSGPHPLSPTALYAVHGDALYVAESLTPTIRVYDASGALVRQIHVPLSAPAVSPTITREVVDSAVVLEQANPSRLPARWSGLDGPISIFWDFIVDELGFVWVRPYDPWRHSLALDGLPGGFGGPGGRWLVLSSEGAEVGWIDVPAGLEPVQVTRDAVVGSSHGNSGLAFVRVHPLTRR